MFEVTNWIAEVDQKGKVTGRPRRVKAVNDDGSLQVIAPARGYSRGTEEVTIPREALASYARVCGMSVSSRDGFSASVCGRLVKEEGMCALHVSAKRRREQNDQARREEWRAARQAETDDYARIDALGFDKGLIQRGSSGTAVVPISLLEKLVQEAKR